MRLDHIGVAVKDLDEARRFYGELMGLELGEVEELPERQLKVCFVKVGDANVELLWPTSPDSAVGKFIEKKGPGIHHLCYRVDDIKAKLEQLKEAGVKLIDQEPKPGAHNTLVAFVHPKATGGVLTELSQPAS